MKNRDNRLFLVLFEKYFKQSAILLLFIWFGTNLANATTPLLTDFEILFDWDDNNYSQDALPVYSDDEEISSNENIFEFAYVINTSPKVKITIDTDCSNSFILLIYAKAVDGNGFDICYTNYNYTHSTGEFYFNIPISNYISKFNFKWEWSVTAIPSCSTPSTFSSNSFVKTTEQHLYVILDEPNEPMETAWASVLNHACNWASGQTNESDIIENLTTELYGCGVIYDGATHHTYPDYSTFHLTDLLEDIKTPNETIMDCRDFSNFICVLANSLGCSGQYNVIKNSSYYYFYYNYLWPAGWSSPDHDNGWTFHQVGWFKFGLFDYKIADPATKIDNDEDPTSTPNTWKLAKGDMTFSSYIDKLSEASLYSYDKDICIVY